MEVLRKIVHQSSGQLTIDLPEEYQNRKLELLVLPFDEEDFSVSKVNYDFSDLTGKLEWKGDALAEQKKLRDEWQ